MKIDGPIALPVWVAPSASACDSGPGSSAHYRPSFGAVENCIRMSKPDLVHDEPGPWTYMGQATRGEPSHSFTFVKFAAGPRSSRKSNGSPAFGLSFAPVFTTTKAK